MADMHKKVAKYIKRFDSKKIAEDEIDGKKVFVCAKCGNPIQRVLTTRRCRYCGEWLEKEAYNGQGNNN